MNAVSPKPAPAGDVLAVAQGYARRGFSVIPLHGVDAEGRCGCGADCDAPGAHPIGGLPRWLRSPATAAQLRQALKEHPAANVGIAIGAVSGMVAVEFDGSEGLATLKELLASRAGESTPIVVNGAGGFCALFRYPAGAALGRYLGQHPGVRVLGDGQFVVMPPSRGAIGCYSFAPGAGLAVDLAPLPPAIATNFERSAPAVEPAADAEPVAAAPENGRVLSDAEQLAEMLDLPAPADQRPAVVPEPPALALAARGLRVFPLRANAKTPAIDRWPARATTDAATIRGWWLDPVTGWAQPENIGVATGTALPGGGFLLVVDIDDKAGKNGSASLAALEARHGALPRTLTARTASGGRHIYLRAPYQTVNTVCKIGQGIDTRGYHGYVVAPGSTIDGRVYEWLDDAPIADLPDAFWALLEQARERERSKTTVAAGVEPDSEANIARAVHYLKHEAPPSIKGNRGDQTAYDVAAKLRDYGISEHAALDAMLEHWNERGSPQWTPEKLAVKVANAYRYGQNPIGQNSPAADFGPVPAKSAAPTEVQSATRPATAEAAPTQPAAPRFKITMLADVRLDDGVPWLVDKLLPAGGLGVIYAAPNVGKSFFAMNLALAVARGMPFYGRPVQQGGALYIAAEDGPGVAVRARAAKRLANLPDDVPFAILPETISLASPKRDLPALFEALDAVADRLGPVRLVVIDTLARGMAGLDENTAADMGAVVATCAAIQKRTGANVLLVHHAGKDAAKGSRGSSVLLAAADTEIKVSVNSRGTRVAEVTKQRNAATGDRFKFSIRKYSVPGADGKSVDTAVMTEIAGTDPAADFAPADVQALKKDSHAEKALSILADLIEAQPPTVSADGLPESATPEAVWRGRFEAAGIVDTQSARQSFKKAKDRLLKGYISVGDGGVSLTPVGHHWIDANRGQFGDDNGDGDD